MKAWHLGLVMALASALVGYALGAIGHYSSPSHLSAQMAAGSLAGFLVGRAAGPRKRGA